MSEYLQKAHNNVIRAGLLVDNGLTIPSAHPAYYSAFLTLKYVLAHFNSVDYAQQDEITRGKDSHNILSNKALSFMANADLATKNDYIVWYNKLKKMRRQADYKPDVIEDAHLIENLKIAKNFIGSVSRHFKIA